MYAGDGYLINAPETGEVVQFAPVSSWVGQIVAMRDPGARDGCGQARAGDLG